MKKAAKRRGFTAYSQQLSIFQAVAFITYNKRLALIIP